MGQMEPHVHIVQVYHIPSMKKRVYQIPVFFPQESAMLMKPHKQLVKVLKTVSEETWITDSTLPCTSDPSYAK